MQDTTRDDNQSLKSPIKAVPAPAKPLHKRVNTQDIGNTNSTSSLFLGRAAKSWMTGPGNVAGVTIPSAQQATSKTVASKPKPKPKPTRLNTNLSGKPGGSVTITRDDWSASTNADDAEDGGPEITQIAGAEATATNGGSGNVTSQFVALTAASEEQSTAATSTATATSSVEEPIEIFEDDAMSISSGEGAAPIHGIAAPFEQEAPAVTTAPPAPTNVAISNTPTSIAGHNSTKAPAPPFPTPHLTPAEQVSFANIRRQSANLLDDRARPRDPPVATTSMHTAQVAPVRMTSSIGRQGVAGPPVQQHLRRPSARRPGLSVQNQIHHASPEIPIMQSMPVQMSPTTANSGPKSPLQKLDYLKEVIRHHGSSFLDRARLAYLERCSISNDAEGLLMHHLLMIRTYHLEMLKSPLGFSPKELAGMDHLDYVFARNGGLTPAFGRALLDFPDPPATVLQSNVRPLIDKAKRALSLLNQNWKPARLQCEQRQIPPSPAEICLNFGMASSELQNAVFMALTKSLQSLEVKHTNEVTAEFRRLQIHGRTMEFNTEVETWAQLYRDATKRVQMRSNPPVAGGLTYQNQSAPVNQSTIPGANNGMIQPPVPIQNGSPTYSSNQNPQALVPGQNGHVSIPDPSLQRGGQAFISQRNVRSSVSSEHSHRQDQQHPLLPAERILIAQAVRPNTDRVALHQANLRDSVPSVVDSADNPTPTLRLYRVAARLVAKPYLLTEKFRYSEHKFEIPETSMLRKAQSRANKYSSLASDSQIFKEGSIAWRLRCVSRSSSSEPLKEEDFYSKGTFWPQHLFITLNDDAHVELRRKQHYGRALPAPLSSVHIGTNTLAISYDQVARESAGKEFWIAVEEVEAISYQTIRDTIKQIPAETVIESIGSALKPVNDDDIVITASGISIDLNDPFTATIWKIPTRGKGCKHRECFDLDNFLDTRSKEHPNVNLYTADEWKCPHCREDARPMNLVIDGFLLGVRGVLEAQGKLEFVKSILVRENGEWEVKEDQEEKPSDNAEELAAGTAPAESSMNQQQQIMTAPRAASTPTTAVDAILLDDDD